MAEPHTTNYLSYTGCIKYVTGMVKWEALKPQERTSDHKNYIMNVFWSCTQAMVRKVQLDSAIDNKRMLHYQGRLTG